MAARGVPAYLYTFASVGEATNMAFATLVGGWTAIALLGPWLARRSAVVRFSLALVFLLAIGIADYLMVYGTSSWQALWAPASSRPVPSVLRWYGTCALALVLGLAMSGVGCRRFFARRRFLIWMALGTFAGAAVGIGLELAQLHPLAASRVSWGLLALAAALSTAGVGALCYCVNVAFVAVALRSPLYECRLRSVLGLPQREATSQVPVESGPRPED